MSNGSKSWCWTPPKLPFQINQIAFWSSPLIHTVALKGLHYTSFSLHYINFDLCEKNTVIMYTISYPLFADADTGIYPHAASQYHARPKAKRGIAMLNVDKFTYPRKQTKGNEFIPCSNNICDILKHFRSFKSQLSRTAVGIAIVTS